MLRDAAEHGLPHKDILLIDVHGHLGAHTDPYIPEYGEKEQLVLFNRTLERVGVDYVIVSMFRGLNMGELQSNLDLAHLMETNRKILGYITYIPFMQQESLAIADQCFQISDRFVGMKIHPDMNYYPIDGPLYTPLWEYANAKKLIVLVHTWGESPYADPVRLYEIAKTYQDTIILIGHSGGFGKGISTAIDLSNRFENVYLDLTGAFIHSQRTLEYFVRMVNSDKLLFSSDSTYNSITWEIGNILYSRVPDEIKLKVLGINARKLLKNYIG